MSDGPKLTILEPNRGGRPRAPRPHDAPVSSRLPAAEYDTLVAAANARGVSVSAYVRAAIRAGLRAPGRR